jgi:hypothetical protein
MAKQTINVGTTANDGTGDALRTAFTKVNNNFTEVYNGKVRLLGSNFTSLGANVTGTTTETLSASLLIPANTLNADAYLNIYGLFERIGASVLGAINCNMYKNTTNSLTGATKIATLSSMAAAAKSYSTMREMYITGGVITYMSNSASLSSNIASANFSDQTTTFNVGVDNYIIFAVQLANAADTGRCKIFRVTSYELN